VDSAGQKPQKRLKDREEGEPLAFLRGKKDSVVLTTEPLVVRNLQDRALDDLIFPGL
jgi:hypothetical protein